MHNEHSFKWPSVSSFSFGLPAHCDSAWPRDFPFPEGILQKAILWGCMPSLVLGNLLLLDEDLEPTCI